MSKKQEIELAVFISLATIMSGISLAMYMISKII